jgi:ribose/xylose/arabinose/galactoside ABC-type transport system permease subunit
MVNNGLNLLNVPIFYQELTVGVLMLGALAVNISQGFDVRRLFRRQA